jgi:hypothetical protein
VSDIPQAREVLLRAREIPGLPDQADALIAKAIRLMWREPQLRRAPGKRMKIDASLRRRIKELAATTSMTEHQIANVTGVRNSGRISEVLHNKRRKKK